MRRNAGNVLIMLAGLVLLASAAAKLAGVPAVVRQLEAFGFQGMVTFLAILEAGGAFLLLAPVTRVVGLLFVSSYLGGAVATHLQHAESPLAPALVLALAWIGFWMRHPDATSVVSDSKPGATAET